MIELRYYQQDAKEAFYDHLTKRDDNPCIVIPTAGGKTPVIASICADAVNLWQGRVLVLAHVKELLEQTADKLNKMCPEVRYGIYSAGLGRREKSAPVIIAGIQSVFRRAEEMGAFDLVLVDEAHMIPPDGDGMYRQFLAEAKTVNPEVRVGGLTATPYRLKTGPICTPDGILNHVCYEVGVRELMARGHISKVTSKDAKAKADLSKVDIRRGEFDSEQMESAFNQDDLVEAACREIVERAGGRKSILIFTSGIDHGEHVTQVLRRLTGEEVNFLTGETDTWRRDEILDQFKEQAYRWLVNVNVLTTGFDAPGIDCVALLRSTLSPGLYYQMVGRGFRLHQGKENCLVLDFGGNVTRHGPVDKITARKNRMPGRGGNNGKTCPQCDEVVASNVSVCPCGYLFIGDEGKPKHNASAGEDGVVSGETKRETLRVSSVKYAVHKKKGADDSAPKTLRVDYWIGFARRVSEWVCLEHSGFARNKAVAWWVRRSILRPPVSAAEGAVLAERGALAEPTEIVVETVAGDKFPRIVEYTLGPVPQELREVEDEPAEENWVAAAGEFAGEYAGVKTNAFTPDDLDFLFGENLPDGEDEVPF